MINLENQTNEKSAFVAIVGKPNVGKSSILNNLIGAKLSIVSKKPQTTRTRIMGVWTENEYQLVFIDTPGLIKPKNSLGEYMVKAVSNSVAGVDACLLVIEAHTKVSPADLELVAKFKSMNLPALLAINKIDLVENKQLLLEQIVEYTKLFDFDAIIPVSARKDEGMDKLKEELKKLAMPGGHFFSEDTLTDQPERVIVSEIVREKVLRILDKEIPHGVAVVTDKMSERGNITDILMTIYCEKDSHKGIIIGKNGKTLKEISTKARIDMEKFLDCKVNLQTWVKVKEDWRARPQILHTMGFDAKDFEEK